MNEQIVATVKMAGIGGSAVATVGWLSSVDWIAIIGVLVLVGSFIVNLTFRRREDRRKQERWDIEKKILLKEASGGLD